MANQLTTLPFVVDTPGASAIYTGYINVMRFAFTGYTDPTASVEVQTAAGDVIVRLDGNTDLSEVESYFTGWVNGLLVPVNQSAAFGGNPNMTSGVLVIQPA